MASQFSLVSLSLAFLLCNCQADLISDVCSIAINPSLCTKTLTSDPRSRGADLRGLGQIAIEKAKAATGATITVAKSVSNAKNKHIIDECIESFNYAIHDLNACSQLLKKSDKISIDDLRTKGSGASTNVVTCDDEFGESEPVKLKEASKRATDLISILLAIASKL